MVEKPSKTVPALVGGVTLGLLSAIPIINIGNYCCCLWVLVGGAIASYMLINRSPYLPVRSGEGASVGALAGVFGSLVFLVLGVPLFILWGGANLAQTLETVSRSMDNPDAARTMREFSRMFQSGAGGILVGLGVWLFNSIFYIGFGAIGGMLGVSFFEKRKGNPPGGGYPPQGPPYGPPPGSPYGSPPQGPPYGQPPGAPYGSPPQGSPYGGGGGWPPQGGNPPQG
ncbi:MAG TPA: hypothetical protein VLZ81_14755 [Blastocatellia bacterium]|nr:hypothetical protein [Blastocatellia bacterium]